MELLNKTQAQANIKKMDEANIPFSVTNGMVASILNYLLNLGLGNSSSLADLALLRKEFEGLRDSVGYPGGIANLNNYGTVPREKLSRSIFLFDGFRSCGDLTFGGLIQAPEDSKIYFDNSKGKFFIQSGPLLNRKNYLTWGSNYAKNKPGSSDMGPHFSSLYIYNNELYIWDGLRLQMIASFQGNALYDDTEINNRLQELANSVSNPTLDTLKDVSTGNLSNGQVLMYNGTKWVNHSIDNGLDEDALKSYLVDNSYAKKSDIPTLSGYATQTWVTSKGYLTSHQDISGKADKAELTVKADKAVNINAGTGLTGGGSLEANRTISLAESGVTAGTYTKVTVDNYGRVISGSTLLASDIPSLAISKITGLQTALTNLGSLISDHETSINDLETSMTGLQSSITDLQTVLSGKADKTVSINAGTGLSGGGTLAANRTISLAESGVTAGTYTKVTVDKYGRIISGSTIQGSDILSKLLTVDGPDSGLDADMLDGLHASGFMRDYGGDIEGKIYDVPTKRIFSGDALEDAPVNGWVSGLVLGSNWNSNHYQHYLIESGGRWYATREYENGAMKNWKTFAYLSDNVASASKLANTRYFWGQSFDGTQSVSGDMTNVGHITPWQDNTCDCGSKTSHWNAVRTRQVVSAVESTLWIWQSKAQPIGFATSGAERMRLTPDGLLGLGITSPSEKFDVAGNVRCFNLYAGTSTTNGGVEIFHATPYIDFHFGRSAADYTSRIVEEVSGRLALLGTLRVSVGVYSDGYVSARGQNTSSDKRLKSITGKMSLDVKRIANAPSVSFKWNEDGARDLGSIAQYWRDISPLLTPKDLKGYLTLQYGKAALLSVISVARETVNLEERVNALEKENRKLKRKIEILERR